MKDFIGQEISKGDMVIIPRSEYQGLRMGLVDSFTSKMVRVSFYGITLGRRDYEVGRNGKDKKLIDPENLYVFSSAKIVEGEKQ